MRNLQIGNKLTVAGDLQVNNNVFCYGSQGQFGAASGGNVETKQLVVKNALASTSAWRATASVAGDQLNFKYNTPFAELTPLQLTSATAGVQINGNLTVTGSINSNVKASNVIYSQSAQQLDTTVQDTLAAMQNSISLMQGSITQLPSTYQLLITSSNKLSYSLLVDVPNLNIYATKTELATSLQAYQLVLNDSTNKLPYSYISGVPNFVTATAFDDKISLYVLSSSLTATLTGYQQLIITTNKIDYNNINGTPDLTAYQPLLTNTNKLDWSLIKSIPSDLVYFSMLLGYGLKSGANVWSGNNNFGSGSFQVMYPEVDTIRAIAPSTTIYIRPDSALKASSFSDS